MVAVCRETPKSPEIELNIETGAVERIVTKWYIHNADTVAAAGVALFAAITPLYTGVPLARVSYTPVGINDYEGQAFYAWANPAPPPQKPEDPNEYSFNTTGGTAHINQAIAVTATYNAAVERVAPDLGTLINVDKDGNVAGLDIPIPALQFEVRKTFDRDDVDTAFTVLLHDMTGTVNNDSWMGFEAYEMRFDGATGDMKTTGPVTLSYRFSFSRNATGLTVGNITGVDKRGWDYLDPYIELQEDETAMLMVPHVRCVRCLQVLPYTDFDSLGLGS